MPDATEKYRVTAVALNIRIMPSTTARIIGHLVKGEVIEKLGVSPDGWWIWHKHGVLEGWSSKKFLVKVGDDLVTCLSCSQVASARHAAVRSARGQYADSLFPAVEIH